MRERIWAPLPLLLRLLLLPPPPLWGGPPDSLRPEREPEPGPLQPFDLLYASGVAAYYGGGYEQAVRDLEAALRSHRRLREIRVRCGRHCAARRPLAPSGVWAGAELPLFRALLERARCYRSCETQRLGGPASRHRVSEDVRSDFQRRVPYNYLQRAYIKVP
ncbi:Prolyl 3-hydroxylase 2 [Galemys pyrenaicus]|uniref:Prolyl 3-hydroxylase 2 n=1 Tax=Galemys pyrenaicus TaxID=202257 RepID=A0A8J6DQA5_GALPY|nr:Prolyl 3-hydroxylase 2 [Galemys pyrenaicus]